ncbi:MAG: WD40 repeat domain-containing protein, partial [Bacteroidota bacterium]
GRDAHLKIWEVAKTYDLAEDIVAHMYAINNVHFSPNGKHFVTCSMDKSIKVWDAATFRLLKVIDKARHAGHGTSVNKLYWSPFSNQLVSCSDDRTISIWDIKFERKI